MGHTPGGWGFDMRQLRGPIGVPTSSRTPEEIAVSVAAELIAVRNAAGTP